MHHRQPESFKPTGLRPGPQNPRVHETLGPQAITASKNTLVLGLVPIQA